MIYAIAKIFHLFALILWIGPALGAYVFLFAAHKTKDRERIIWVERLTEKVLVLEHVALAVLIASGVVMLHATGWTMLQSSWLVWKLILFAGVMLFEIGDMWIAHVALHRILEKSEPDRDPKWKPVLRTRARLMPFAAVVGFVLIPGIVYLAVFKP
jgi:uncharacterized membrane protein